MDTRLRRKEAENLKRAELFLSLLRLRHESLINGTLWLVVYGKLSY